MTIDLAKVKERAEVYEFARRELGPYNGGVTGSESADDVPALVAEVERLRALPTLAEAVDTLPATNHEYEAWMREHGLGHGAGVGAVISAVRADLRKLADGSR